MLIPATQFQKWTNPGQNDISGVDSIAISPDGAHIAVGRLDGHVELRDAYTGGVIASALVHRFAVHVVRFQPNRLAITSGGADRSVFLWDCSKRTPVKLGTHADFVSSLAFSQDGSTMASGGADGAIRLWHMEITAGEFAESRLLTSFIGHLGEVKALAINKAGQVLSGSEDKTLRIWDRDSGGELAQFDAGGEVNLVFAEDALHRAVAATKSGSIRTWDLEHRDEEFTIYNTGTIATIAISPWDRYVAAAGQDGVITVWNLSTATVFRTVKIPSAAPAVWSICFTPDGEHLVSGGEDGVIRLWDLADKTAKEFRFGDDLKKKNKTGNVWTIAIQPNQPYVAFGVAAGDLSTIQVMDLQTWTPVRTIEHHNGSVWSITFSHSGELLAVGSGDNNIDLWSVHDLRVPEPHLLVRKDAGEEMWGVPFSPDDKSLATAGLERRVRIWGVPNLDVTESFDQKYDHAGLVQSADFDSTGQWVATASVDRTIKLWNLQTHEVIPIGGHDEPALAFSRTSDTFVSGGLDRRLVVSHLGKIERVFHASPAELFRDARKHTCQDLVGFNIKYVGCPNSNGSQREVAAEVQR